MSEEKDIIIVYARIPKELWHKVKQKRPEFRYLPNSSIIVSVLAEWLEKL